MSVSDEVIQCRLNAMLLILPVSGMLVLVRSLSVYAVWLVMNVSVDAVVVCDG